MPSGLRKRRTAAALGAAAALAATGASHARGAVPVPQPGPGGAAGGASQAALVAQGAQLYGETCISCHGANGEGSGAARARLGAGAGPAREQHRQSGDAPSLQGVGALAADFVLRTGYMPLPRFGLQPRRSRVLFTEQEIRALVAYVASLGPGPAIPQPDPARGSLSEGLRLFTGHCAGCHQVVAAGGALSGAVAPPLEDATPTQIAEAVRLGPNVMPPFPRSVISDRQLDSLVAYVTYAKHPQDRGGWSLGHIGPVPEGLVTWLLAGLALLATCVVIGSRLRRG